jgi:hypothetical protein
MQRCFVLSYLAEVLSRLLGRLLLRIDGLFFCFVSKRTQLKNGRRSVLAATRQDIAEISLFERFPRPFDLPTVQIAFNGLKQGIYPCPQSATRPIRAGLLQQQFTRRRWDSRLETGQEEQSLTADDHVFILAEAAINLTVTRGMGAPEPRICYERVESLCRSVNRPGLLYSALIGKWRYCLTNGKHR